MKKEKENLQFQDSDIEWLDEIRKQFKQETGREISRDQLVSISLDALKREIDSKGFKKVITKIIKKKE